MVMPRSRLSCRGCSGRWRRPARRTSPARRSSGRASGSPWRSRCGAAAAAGSTVSTPTNWPSRRSGSPWAEPTPRRASSLSGARRPSARATRGCCVRITDARNGESDRGRGLRTRDCSECRLDSAITERKGAALSVEASCTHRETRGGSRRCAQAREQVLQRRPGVEGADGTGRTGAARRVRLRTRDQDQQLRDVLEPRPSAHPLRGSRCFPGGDPSRPHPGGASY
jgi:hypothetical protein